MKTQKAKKETSWPRRMAIPGFLAIISLLVALVKCNGHARQAISSRPRGINSHSVIELIDIQPSRLFAISDIHGGYDRMISLFVKHGLTTGAPGVPSATTWAGGNATIVVVGDVIDKGNRSLEVIESLMALESSARSAGGRVIVLTGNHEAEFFVKPRHKKSRAFHDELAKSGITPEDFAAGKDPRGAWLRERPLGVRVGRWFFAHAGDTHGRSLNDLASALEQALRTNGYGHAEITGDTSLLESRDWFVADTTRGARYARALGAEHIVFGHDPSALGPKGRIAVGQGGAILRIDCGMSPPVDYSEGCMLLIVNEGASHPTPVPPARITTGVSNAK